MRLERVCAMVFEGSDSGVSMLSFAPKDKSLFQSLVMDNESGM
jgi:hypothetical protein